MRIAPKLHFAGADIERSHPMLDLPLIAMHDAERIRGEHGDFVVGQIDDPLGMPDKRRVKETLGLEVPNSDSMVCRDRYQVVALEINTID